jgi:hypothetical protein
MHSCGHYNTQVIVVSSAGFSMRHSLEPRINEAYRESLRLRRGLAQEYLVMGVLAGMVRAAVALSSTVLH